MKRSLLCYVVMLELMACAGSKTFDLGGECLPAPTAFNTSRFKALDQAQKSGDYKKVVELQKLEVRDMCDNEYRWFTLAKFYLKNHEETKAIEILEMWYDKQSQEVETTLDSNEFQTLKECAVFKTSRLAKKIQANQALSQKRHHEFQEKLSGLSDKDKPKMPYVSKGACPFECCTYRHWSVEKETTLFEKPDSQKIVGKAGAGTMVTGITGDVYVTEPLAVGVIFPVPNSVSTVSNVVPLQQGDILFLLHYLGEGNFLGQYNNRRVNVNAEDGIRDYCPHASARCWGEFVLPESRRKNAVWWVKVKLKDGTVGWSNTPENFGNKDGCG